MDDTVRECDVNDIVIHRTDMSSKVLYVFCILGLVPYITMIIISMCMSTSWQLCLFALAGVFTALWIMANMYCMSRQAVCFQKDGIQIIDVVGPRYEYIPWEELQFAYYAQDIRGGLYLILSPEALSEKDVKRLANRLTKRIYIDGKILIFIPKTDDGRRVNLDKIKKIVRNNVGNVQSFLPYIPWDKIDV